MSIKLPFEVFIGMQIPQGFAFGLFYSAMMAHVQVISPHVISMTMNNISLALFFNVSSLVGNVGGSKLYEIYGGATMFRVCAVVSAVWAGIVLLYQWRTGQSRIGVIPEATIQK